MTAKTLTEVAISAIDTRRLALPTGMKSFTLPNGHQTPTDLSALLVRVHDADGGTGQSLLWAQRPQQLDLFDAALGYLAEVVTGQPRSISDTVAAMRQAVAFVSSSGVAAFAISGYEMALQDLRVRRSGTSLASSLGVVHETVRAYQTGLMLSATVDELIDEATMIYQSGITAIKMIVGRPTIEEDVQRVRAVRECLPSDAALMVDALQRWSAPDAMRAACDLAELELIWIEDPIPHHDLAGYAQLAQDAPVKIATGETCFARDEFVRLLDIGIPYVIAELERTGGVSGWMEIAALVDERSAVMLPHIYPHVSAQLTAALPQDEVWWEYVPWFDQLMETPFDIHDGRVRPSMAVGSGFDPSPDAIERFAQTPWVSLATT
jgi:L-alanine-DL-glutamate epimerase-like enolase superfamily enzyme